LVCLLECVLDDLVVGHRGAAGSKDVVVLSSERVAGLSGRRSRSVLLAADNGGTTQTRLPQPGSPLIDAIPNASCQTGGASGITTDQRGLPRPGAGSPACDIGAVEVQPPVPSAPTAVVIAPTAVVIAPRFAG